MAEVKLQWDEIISSNIAATSWVPDEDPEADGGVMYVVFNGSDANPESGSMYVYFEVPPEVYDAFYDAPHETEYSPGEYFYHFIRLKYQYEKAGKVNPMVYRRAARRSELPNP